MITSSTAVYKYLTSLQYDKTENYGLNPNNQIFDKDSKEKCYKVTIFDMLVTDLWLPPA